MALTANLCIIVFLNFKPTGGGKGLAVFVLFFPLHDLAQEEMVVKILLETHILD